MSFQEDLISVDYPKFFTSTLSSPALDASQEDLISFDEYPKLSISTSPSQAPDSFQEDLVSFDDSPEPSTPTSSSLQAPDSSQDNLISFNDSAPPTISTTSSQDLPSWYSIDENTHTFTSASFNNRGSSNNNNNNSAPRRPLHHQTFDSSSSSSIKHQCAQETPRQTARHQSNDNHIDNVRFARILRGDKTSGCRMVVRDEIWGTIEPIPEDGEITRDEEAEMRRDKVGRLMGGRRGMYPKRRVRGWGVEVIRGEGGGGGGGGLGGKVVEGLIEL